MTSQFNLYSIEAAGLLGAVKQVQQVCYKAHKKKGVIVQGKIQLDYQHSSENYIINYNEKGLKISDEVFATNGKYITTYNDRFLPAEILHYDKNGNLNQKTTTTYHAQGGMLSYVVRNADGSLFYRTEDKYDAQGKPYESVQYMGDDEVIIRKIITTYNEQGNQLSAISYKQDGSLDYQFLHTYNAQGKEIASKTEFTNSKSSGRSSTQKYNEQGDCIEHNFYHGDGTLNFSCSYTHQYNEQGKCIETTGYSSDGRISGFTAYQYNEQGQCIKTTHYDSQRNITNMATSEYDEQGKKIEPAPIPYIPPKNPHQTEELEYDARGNWIKKTVIYNKIPINLYLREIAYFDDASANTPLVHPLTNKAANTTNTKTNIMENTNEPKTMNNESQTDLTTEQAQWLAETVANGAFPAVRYYALINKELPSEYVHASQDVEAFALLDELVDTMEAKIIHSYSGDFQDNSREMIRYTLIFPNKGYILDAFQIQTFDAEQYELPEFIKDDNSYVHISQLNLLRPSEASGKRDDEFEYQLQECIEKCTIQRIKIPEKPVINMIEVTANGYAMREHDVDDDFEINDLDVNYGYGFEKFHDELMQRFNTQTKGLALFHGLPGTGKTYYIRHLLRKMATGNKVVIYMPPNMVDYLVEPAFMTFISNAVTEWNDEEQFCVLLIEDAEPLLAKRQEGIRIQGVSNLLNMTDGLLNDMLNMQIICTFNVDLKKLDSALLRPGRLLARKEFKPLSELDANLLAQRLGIKHHFKKPATLGEIYALQKNKSTLIHDVEPDKGASTNIDDL